MKTPHDSRRKFLKGCAAGAAGLAVQSVATRPMFGLMRSGLAGNAHVAQSAGSGAICGLFNAHYVYILQNTGAQANRLLLNPIRYNNSGMFDSDPAESAVITTLFQTWPQGVDVIITLYWVNNQNSLPASSDFSTYAGYATAMLQDIMSLLPAGVTISVVALENEPFNQYAPSDLTLNANNESVAGNFWTVVASTLAAWRSSNNYTFGISTPAYTHTTNSAYEATFKKWLKNEVATTTDITYFDFHAHVSSIGDMKSLVSDVSPLFGNLTVMCTEWSQAPAFGPWLNKQVDPCFAKNYSVPGDVNTNLDYIESFNKEDLPPNSTLNQRDPVTLAEWNAWLATAGAQTDFISEAYSFLTSNGVTIPCYGGAVQYGSPTFDVDPLYANNTVDRMDDGTFYPNYNFLHWYQQISGATNSGSAGDQPCPVEK